MSEEFEVTINLPKNYRWSVDGKDQYFNKLSYSAQAKFFEDNIIPRFNFVRYVFEITKQYPRVHLHGVHVALAPTVFTKHVVLEGARIEMEHYIAPGSGVNDVLHIKHLATYADRYRWHVYMDKTMLSVACNHNLRHFPDYIRSLKKSDLEDSEGSL